MLCKDTTFLSNINKNIKKTLSVLCYSSPICLVWNSVTLVIYLCQSILNAVIHFHVKGKGVYCLVCGQVDASGIRQW